MKYELIIFCWCLHWCNLSAQQASFEAQQYQADVLQSEIFEALNALADDEANAALSPAQLSPADDLDNDGMTDAWELMHGLDPADPKDAFGDEDDDQVDNLFEFQMSSNPNSATTPLVTEISITDTLLYAIQSAAPNTVIRLQSGTYTLNYIYYGNKKIMLQGGWNSDFTVQDNVMHPTILDGQNIKEIFYIGNPSSILPDTSAIVLEALHFKRGNGFFGAVNFISKKGVMRISMKDCSITESKATTSFSGALNLRHWNGTGLADFTMVNTLIASNLLVNGITCQNTEGSQANWRFINSTITNNKSVVNGAGHGYEGFTLDNGSAKVIKIVNSIFSGNEEVDIQFRRHIIINASYSNIDSIYTFPYTVADGTIFNAGDGMINADAQFVDSAAINYYLLPGSPCLDSGVDVGLPYLGAAPDMGAFEGAGTSGLPDNEQVAQVFVSPNPANSEFTIDLNTGAETVFSDEVILRVYNTLGQEVLHYKLHTPLETIACHHLPRGLYFYSASLQNMVIGSGKLQLRSY